MNNQVLHYNLNTEIYVNSGNEWIPGSIVGYDKTNNTYTVFCSSTSYTMVDIPEWSIFPLFKYLNNILSKKVVANNSVFTPVASYATQTEAPRYAECVVTLQHEILRLRQKVDAISPPTTPVQPKEAANDNETNENESLYSLPSLPDSLSDVFSEMSHEEDTRHGRVLSFDEVDNSNSVSESFNETSYLATKGIRNGKRKSPRLLESTKTRAKQTHI